LVVEAMALKAKSQIAFLNKGSLRAGLAGRVTVGSVLTALPFNDRLLRATLPGQTLLDLLTRFGRKGFTGFPLYHGLSLYAYPAGEAVRLAGARLYDGQELLPQREYALAISGQMARLLTDSLPLKVEPAGGLQDALIDLIRARAQAAEPLGPAQAQPYRFFPDQASAERAFVERLAD
jgi:2',3'-cyclic-nucleotide 2'-phosphodiesterase (5'-nucleotidase family)